MPRNTVLPPHAIATEPESRARLSR
ncbi:Protein of unknown function [Thermobacillus xylanilyticus]|uniref:Uncharacterized protein n=1 Tax=Thermobacillus xylanilyticus TaxID=76633 RepID=A0ABN7RFW4_THEXY|nr:Protein of unknown function [Thermobacillus xylanilyticus]